MNRPAGVWVLSVVVGVSVLGLVACSGAPEERVETTSSALVENLLPGVEASDPQDGLASSYERCKFPSRGERLFKCETFGGNGRTCATCHGAATGTFSPAEARALFAEKPNAPLFRPIDSDFGLGLTYTRLVEDAVIRAAVDLPPNVTVAQMPGARTILLNRGVPTTMNTPALDVVLMADGRAPNLSAQALGAIHGHAQSTIEPTPSQLSAIERYEQTLFSSAALEQFAERGTPPQLPPGTTDAEKRGRVLFVDGPNGKCAGCHSGPMLNATTRFNANAAVPAGSRFETALVSEFNAAHNPVYTFVFKKADGSTMAVDSPDPGRALATGVVDDAFPVATFKIPTLWGVSRTAPYFHDNSAKTLEDLGAHYQRFFIVAAALFNRPDLIMSDGERDDMLAYLRLL